MSFYRQQAMRSSKGTTTPSDATAEAPTEKASDKFARQVDAMGGPGAADHCLKEYVGALIEKTERRHALSEHSRQGMGYKPSKDRELEQMKSGAWLNEPRRAAVLRDAIVKLTLERSGIFPNAVSAGSAKSLPPSSLSTFPTAAFVASLPAVVAPAALQRLPDDQLLKAYSACFGEHALHSMTQRCHGRNTEPAQQARREFWFSGCALPDDDFGDLDSKYGKRPISGLARITKAEVQKKLDRFLAASTAAASTTFPKKPLTALQQREALQAANFALIKKKNL